MNEVMFVTGGELLQFLPISSKKRVGMSIYIPKFSFTTDNAAMIANTGYYKYLDNDFCTIDKPAYSRVTI